MPQHSGPGGAAALAAAVCILGRCSVQELRSECVNGGGGGVC
eukprot:COSAG02_NODE_36767_length_450_cov_47.193732_1_plen_41_part_01